MEEIDTGGGETDAVHAVRHRRLGAAESRRVSGHRHGGRVGHPRAGRRVGTHAAHPVVRVAVVGRQGGVLPILTNFKRVPLFVVD